MVDRRAVEEEEAEGKKAKLARRRGGSHSVLLGMGSGLFLLLQHLRVVPVLRPVRDDDMSEAGCR